MKPEEAARDNMAGKVGTNTGRVESPPALGRSPAARPSPDSLHNPSNNQGHDRDPNRNHDRRPRAHPAEAPSKPRDPYDDAPDDKVAGEVRLKVAGEVRLKHPADDDNRGGHRNAEDEGRVPFFYVVTPETGLRRPNATTLIISNIVHL